MVDRERLAPVQLPEPVRAHSLACRPGIKHRQQVSGQGLHAQRHLWRLAVQQWQDICRTDVHPHAVTTKPSQEFSAEIKAGNGAVKALNPKQALLTTSLHAERLQSCFCT